MVAEALIGGVVELILVFSVTAAAAAVVCVVVDFIVGIVDVVLNLWSYSHMNGFVSLQLAAL